MHEITPTRKLNTRSPGGQVEELSFRIEGASIKIMIEIEDFMAHTKSAAYTLTLDKF